MQEFYYWCRALKKKKVFFFLIFRYFLLSNMTLVLLVREVKNKTSKLHYVIELFGSFLCLPPLFSTRRHSISLLSTDSRTLCYLILFGRRFSSTIRPMIPTDDKIQNSKSGNFTVRKMRSYWNYLWCVFNSLVIPLTDLETKGAASCIMSQHHSRMHCKCV